MALVAVERVLAAVRERLPSVLFRVVSFPVSLLFGIIASSLALLARVARVRPNFASISFPSWPFSRPPAFDTSPLAASRRFVAYVQRFDYTQPAYGPSTSKPPSAPALDFHIGSYNDALQAAKHRLCLFVPILLSSKHDNTSEFIKSVLYNPELVTFFRESNVLVWGGDVLESDAYHASQILHAHEYPFLAFISLSKPSPLLNPGQTSPKMTVHSRLSGKAATAASITSHMQTSFIPRSRAFLARLRSERQAREQERMLRAQQDAEYRQAQERDRARVLEKMRAQEEERARAAQAEAAAEEKRQARARKEIIEQKRKAWRAWARQNILDKANQEGEKSDLTRIMLRLPDGRRMVRMFRREESVRLLYVWADCSRCEEESTVSIVKNPEDTGEYTHEFPFGLATSFPRTCIPLDAQQIKDIDGLIPSGNLVVEELEDDDDDEEEEGEEESEEEKNL